MSTLNIIVTVKQVPDTAEVRIDPKTNSLMREGVPSIINPEDRNALEAALVLREAHGGTVTALSMGPPQARAALEEALCMGVDRAILLSDRAFAGSDTLITAFTLSRAIMKIATYDLILAGRQAIDGDTAQVGPQIAGFLDLPQVTYAEGLELKAAGVLIVQRGLEGSTQWVQVKLPALVTVTGSINHPRYPSLYNVADSCDDAKIKTWAAKDLQLPQAMLGLAASPTTVKKIFEPDRKMKGEMIPGDEREMAAALIGKLKELHVI
jgi:electron transfer flavoprotein beta subunit